MTAAKTNIRTTIDLYRTDSSARALFDALAAKPTTRDTIDVESLLAMLATAGSNMSHLELIRVLREMEKDGAGDLVVGRRGAATRFHFAGKPHIIARAAAGADEKALELDDLEAGERDDATEFKKGRTSVKPVDELTPPVRVAKGSPPVEVAPRREASFGSFDHVYQLRRDFRVEMTLPEDITPEEVARLTKFLQSLV